MYPSKGTLKSVVSKPVMKLHKGSIYSIVTPHMTNEAGVNPDKERPLLCTTCKSFEGGSFTAYLTVYLSEEKGKTSHELFHLITFSRYMYC